VAAKQGLGAIFVLFAIAGACTHDFDQFDVEGATGGTTSTGGKSAASGSTSTGGVVTVGKGGSGSTSGGSTSMAGSNDAGGMAGSAGAGGCDAGEKDCGTCVPLTDPGTGCATLDDCNPCALDHATETCGGGLCAIDQCEAGFDDCNTEASDGCEYPVDADVSHCGACNRACNSAGVASLDCTSGACASSCAPGKANCGQPATGDDDGCETDVSSSTTQCGSCDNSCDSGFECSSGLCGCAAFTCGSGPNQECNTGSRLCECTADSTLDTCRPGEQCRSSGSDRYCSCNGSSDAPCSDTQICCNTPAGCVDYLTDAANCGACGHACTPGFVCVAGGCQCDDDVDCGGLPASNGGAGGDGGAGGASSGPTCAAGVCACSGSACSAGQRCLTSGSCG
jgi:hypothetical protein